MKRAINASLSDTIHAVPKQDAGISDPETIQTQGIINELCLSNDLKMTQDYIAILDLSGKCLWANDTLSERLMQEIIAIWQPRALHCTFP